MGKAFMKSDEVVAIAAKPHSDPGSDPLQRDLRTCVLLLSFSNGGWGCRV